MGNYYCKKCNVPITQHHIPSRNSCRGDVLLNNNENMERHDWQLRYCCCWIPKI